MNHFLWMRIARELSIESKCVSRQVGAVLVKNNAIISTGVNGSPSGLTNCCERFPRYNSIEDREEHHKWSIDHELHAEVNLFGKVIQNQTNIEGSTLYVTLQPCSSCATMIISSGGVKEVIFDSYYDKGSMDGIENLKNAGISVTYFGDILNETTC